MRTQFAKSVISQLHRKKIGRKRMLVSYCKETINDISTLGYQVAGLLKVYDNYINLHSLTIILWITLI